MNIGDRVVHLIDGSVGHVEDIDQHGFVDVRWLTPNNEPSACIGTTRLENLECCSNHVIPMPRSKEWWREAREFCALVQHAVEASEAEGEIQ